MNTCFVSAYTESLRKQIGERVKEARVDKGLTLDKLGAKAGLGRSHLIKIEQGKILPRPETVKKIARATGRKADWFTSSLDEAA